MELVDGSRVGVIGAGPSGSLTSYFILDLAERVGLDLELDLYESKDFLKPGPAGCNNCGGIVSESLVQMLATEGINLPPSVVQRAIESYVLHSEVGRTSIETPLQEMRIGAVHRGAGPRGSKEARWESFDGHLMRLALDKGAHFVHARVDDLSLDGERPCVHARGHSPRAYDLLVGAVGINSPALKLFEKLGIRYRRPKDTKTFISEFHLGHEQVDRYVGSSMHVFLLNIPRLEFAALIPKGDFVTLALLGERIDNELIQRFLAEPEVRRCFPPGWDVGVRSCHCAPRLQMRGAKNPYWDRVVLVGDCGVSRLYKDGIGAAYRMAKAAAITVVFEGVSEEAFRRRYWPACRGISRDNLYGRVIFLTVGLMRRFAFLRRAIMRLVEKEQHLPRGSQRAMSSVLWDCFTGSAPYRDIFLRTLSPSFLLGLAGETLKQLVVGKRSGARRGEPEMTERD